MAVERLDNDLESLGGAGRTEERDLSLPPHSIQAEEAVLGSILKNPASIVRVSDFLKPEDFYQQRNKHVFRAMLALFTDGKPIDYHSTADSLTQQGAYEASGGLLYLSELNLATPSAAHIEHYGRIVERTSIMRQLIAKAQTIAEIAYRDNLAPEVALEKAEQLIYGIAEKRVTRDFRSLEDVLTEYMEQIEALQEGEATRYGIPTGYMDLDKLLGGFQRTDLIILAARTSVGKALALDTPISTPQGWTTMGELAVGDQVFDEQGWPCRVTYATPVQLQRECYEVVFSDGERIVADADHQWSVLSDNDRKNGGQRRQRVLTTKAMSAKLRVSGRGNRLNFSIPVAHPVQCPPIDLPLDPYVLGVWLGDGTSTCAVVTLGDAEIVEHIMTAGCQVRARKTRGTPQFALGDGMGRATPRTPKLSYEAAADIRKRLAAGDSGVAIAAQYGVSKASVSLLNSGVTWNGSAQAPGNQSILRHLGLLGRNHVPELYQRASVDQRLALLQGLMDTDGTISVSGRAEFSSRSRHLAEGVYELIAGLGMCPWFRVGRARLEGRDLGPNYRVGFVPTDLLVFRLNRKASRQRTLAARAAARQRSIREINPVPSVAVRCIQVDSPSHLYLAGRTCVPTHNTSFALNLAVNAAVKHNATVAIFSLEMSAEQLASRLLSMESGVDSPRIRSANLNEQESRKLDAAMNHLARAPIWVDDTPSIPIMELRSKARRLAAEHTLDMIVVDYLQLIVTDGGESRVQEIGQISRALKALARELRVPVLALSQLSRAVEQRTPHIPQLSDLRESGCLTGDTLVALASGELAPIASLVEQLPEVVTLDEWQMTTATASKVWRTGFKPVFKLTTRSGRVVRATGNHKFRTLTGWTAMDELRVGDRLAIPRCYPEPCTPAVWDESRIVLLAHLLGDGCYASRQPVHYPSASAANLETVEHAALCAFGITGRYVPQSTWSHLYLGNGANKWHPNPLSQWLRTLGIDGQRSKQKRVPSEVFALSSGQLALFVRHLWATDGSIFVRSGREGHSVGVIYYATASHGLAHDVQHLLSRLGIPSKITQAIKPGYDPSYQVKVQGINAQLQFAGIVGAFGDRLPCLQQLVAAVGGAAANTNVDTIPRDIWKTVRSRMRELGFSQRAMTAARGTAYGGTSHFRFAPSRAMLGNYADILKANDLHAIADSDLFWDDVQSIVPDGQEDVYDMTVPGTHNFVANGIVVHNSLEQDADVVVFIYRDEKYNPDTDKKGVADIIVAKHRNGPTGQVQLLFLERTTKFLDLEVYRS